MPIRSLDDRVAASEHRERRERGETALRGDGALPPERYGTGDRVRIRMRDGRAGAVVETVERNG